MKNPDMPKKRAVISYENMSPELQDAFKEKYPRGYQDYLGDIQKIEKPDGTSFYAVSLEIPGAIYLVKIKVRVDAIDDIEKELFKDPDTEESDSEGGEGFPASDDDIAAAERADSDEE